ncbi:MAG: hypothetical protein WCI05_00075 [Myxococcales bacterium]
MKKIITGIVACAALATGFAVTTPSESAPPQNRQVEIHGRARGLGPWVLGLGGAFAEVRHECREAFDAAAKYNACRVKCADLAAKKTYTAAEFAAACADNTDADDCAKSLVVSETRKCILATSNPRIPGSPGCQDELNSFYHENAECNKARCDLATQAETNASRALAQAAQAEAQADLALARAQKNHKAAETTKANACRR